MKNSRTGALLELALVTVGTSRMIQVSLIPIAIRKGLLSSSEVQFPFIIIEGSKNAGTGPGNF